MDTPKKVTLKPSTLKAFYVTHSKSKTPIARSEQGKFNCNTVDYNGTQEGIYFDGLLSNCESEKK